MAPEQLALVRLLQRARSDDYVEEWRHLFQGAMIRARTAKGRTCTVARDRVEELVSAGIVAPSWGGSFYLTSKGQGL